MKKRILQINEASKRPEYLNKTLIFLRRHLKKQKFAQELYTERLDINDKKMNRKYILSVVRSFGKNAPGQVRKLNKKGQFLLGSWISI